MTPAFAKDRARLLRHELAAASFDVPHSLALELVAHQHGFQDWNTLAATEGRPRPAEPWLEREPHKYVSAAMTLGDLRAVIAGQPDDIAVFVTEPVEPGSTTTNGMPASSASVRPNVMTKRRPALHVDGTHQTGTYRAPRLLVLQLSGLPVGGGPAVAQLIGSVRDAVEELGFRGRRNMGNDVDTGVVTWTFQAHEGIPLSAVEDAVRRVVRRHDPGTWTLTFR